MNGDASSGLSDREKVVRLEREVESLQHQLEWFKRQLFGRKSEKRLPVESPHQPLLTGLVDPESFASPPSPPTERITYERRQAKRRDAGCVTDEGLRFDESVPVEVIELSAPQLLGPKAHEYEVIGHKTTHRLAQRPGSYVVLKYVRPVIKRRPTGALLTVPAPSALWEGSVADVSLVAGILEEKFTYHLPLYRQHQRLTNNGITLSRAVLTRWVHRAVELLRPIYDAQFENILRSRILAMDETPIKAGRERQGKMRRGWLWPIYGDADEIAFTYSPSRARGHVTKCLGDFDGTLLCDGYSAYDHYARANLAVTYAQCWSHTRRLFERAEKVEPEAVAEALERIGVLYQVEEAIRQKKLDREAKLAYRVEYARPGVEAFFEWCEAQCRRMDLVPSNPLSKAIAYAWERRAALSVYLSDPDLQIDTNHIERAIRPVAMGRKVWLFCWTEIGAERVGIIQSLLSTCRLHGVHPFTYLVDVLQRISIHPMSAVEELTPRRWKTLFADNPLRSDLDLIRQ